MNRIFLDPSPLFRNDFDRMMGSFFGGNYAPFQGSSRSYKLPVSMWETENELYVEAEVPGLAMEDIELTITGEELTLRIKEKEKSEEGKYLRRERRTKQGGRTLALPIAVDAERTEALLRNGVLTIRLPKAASAKPRSIPVVSA